MYQILWYPFTVFADLTGLRLIESEEHTHESALSCAVLTEKGMDLAPLELQGDVVVGLDAGELLGDVIHLNHILGSLFHAATYFLL